MFFIQKKHMLWSENSTKYVEKQFWSQQNEPTGYNGGSPFHFKSWLVTMETV